MPFLYSKLLKPDLQPTEYSAGTLALADRHQGGGNRKAVKFAEEFRDLWFKPETKEYKESLYGSVHEIKQNGMNAQLFGVRNAADPETGSVNTLQGVMDRYDMWKKLQTVSVKSPDVCPGDTMEEKAKQQLKMFLENPENICRVGPDDVEDRPWTFVDIAATVGSGDTYGYGFGSPSIRESVMDCWMDTATFDWTPWHSMYIGETNGLIWSGPQENDFPTGLYFPCEPFGNVTPSGYPGEGKSLTHATRFMLDPFDNGIRDRSTWGEGQNWDMPDFGKEVVSGTHSSGAFSFTYSVEVVEEVEVPMSNATNRTNSTTTTVTTTKTETSTGVWWQLDLGKSQTVYDIIVPNPLESGAMGAYIGVSEFPCTEGEGCHATPEKCARHTNETACQGGCAWDGDVCEPRYECGSISDEAPYGVDEGMYDLPSCNEYFAECPAINYPMGRPGRYIYINLPGSATAMQIADVRVRIANTDPLLKNEVWQKDPFLVTFPTSCLPAYLLVGHGLQYEIEEAIGLLGPCRPFSSKEAMERSPLAQAIQRAFDYSRFWMFTKAAKEAVITVETAKNVTTGSDPSNISTITEVTWEYQEGFLEGDSSYYPNGEWDVFPDSVDGKQARAEFIDKLIEFANPYLTPRCSFVDTISPVWFDETPAVPCNGEPTPLVCPSSDAPKPAPKCDLSGSLDFEYKECKKAYKMFNEEFLGFSKLVMIYRGMLLGPGEEANKHMLTPHFFADDGPVSDAFWSIQYETEKTIQERMSPDLAAPRKEMYTKFNWRDPDHSEGPRTCPKKLVKKCRTDAPTLAPTTAPNITNATNADAEGGDIVKENLPMSYKVGEGVVPLECNAKPDDLSGTFGGCPSDMQGGCGEFFQDCENDAKCLPLMAGALAKTDGLFNVGLVAAILNGGGVESKFGLLDPNTQLPMKTGKALLTCLLCRCQEASFWVTDAGIRVTASAMKIDKDCGTEPLMRAPLPQKCENCEESYRDGPPVPGYTPKDKVYATSDPVEQCSVSIEPKNDDKGDGNGTSFPTFAPTIAPTLPPIFVPKKGSYQPCPATLKTDYGNVGLDECPKFTTVFEEDLYEVDGVPVKINDKFEIDEVNGQLRCGISMRHSNFQSKCFPWFGYQPDLQRPLYFPYAEKDGWLAPDGSECYDSDGKLNSETCVPVAGREVLLTRKRRYLMEYRHGSGEGPSVHSAAWAMENGPVPYEGRNPENKEKYHADINHADNWYYVNEVAMEKVLTDWLLKAKAEVFTNAEDACCGEGKVLTITTYLTTSFAEVFNEFKKAGATGIVSAPLMMMAYAMLTLGLGSPRASLLGAVGVIFTFLTIWGALGLSGWLGITWTGNSLNVVPYLILGLGVDDMFLLSHTYKDYVKKFPHLSTVELISKVMSYCGPSISLTSFCNAIVFGLGTLAPLPMAAYYAAQAAIAVIFVYIFMAAGFPSIMACHHAFFYASKANTIAPAEGEVNCSKGEKRDQDGGFVSAYANFVTTLPGKAVLGLVFVVAMTVAGVGMAGFKAELSAKDVFNTDTTEYGFFDMVMNTPAYQQSAPSTWVFQGSPDVAGDGLVPFDFPQLQIFMIHMHNEFLDSMRKKNFLREGSDMNFMETFLLWTSDGPHCTKDVKPYCSKTYITGNKDLEVEPTPKVWSGFDYMKKHNDRDFDKDPMCVAKKMKDRNFKLKWEAPKGETVSEYWKEGLALHPDEFYYCLELWLNKGGLAVSAISHGIQFVQKQLPDPDNPEKLVNWVQVYGYGKHTKGPAPVTMATTDYWTQNLLTPEDNLELVDMARAIQKKYEDVGAFYPNGLAYFLYSQFAQIYGTLSTCFGAGAAAIFGLLFVTFLFLTKFDAIESIVLVVIIMLSVASISFFTAGVFSFAEVYFNVFSLLALITSIGIAVEFTVHVVFAYMNADGTKEERTIAAMEHMLMPVIDSSISTQLGIVPLTFGGQRFIFKYSFMAYTFLVIGGLIAGVVTVPLFLSILGPNKRTK